MASNIPTMAAADLQPGQTVEVGYADFRVVDRVEFTDRPVDSNGTQGVRVYWTDRDRPSTVAVDRQFPVMALFTVIVEAGNADGTIWQAVTPATTAGGTGLWTAQDVLDWTAANQTVADGDRWRVLVWEGEDADTGTEPVAVYEHDAIY